MKNETNPSNIGIKVPDVEWETSGRNVWPPASNENSVIVNYYLKNEDNIRDKITHENGSTVSGVGEFEANSVAPFPLSLPNACHAVCFSFNAKPDNFQIAFR